MKLDEFEDECSVFTRVHGHHFLLRQTSAAAFDKGQVRIGLVGAVDGHGHARVTLQISQLQSVLQDKLDSLKVERYHLKIMWKGTV